MAFLWNPLLEPLFLVVVYKIDIRSNSSSNMFFLLEIDKRWDLRFDLRTQNVHYPL